jgi:hypothetical protein
MYIQHYITSLLFAHVHILVQAFGLYGLHADHAYKPQQAQIQPRDLYHKSHNFCAPVISTLVVQLRNALHYTIFPRTLTNPAPSISINKVATKALTGTPVCATEPIVLALFALGFELLAGFTFTAYALTTSSPNPGTERVTVRSPVDVNVIELSLTVAFSSGSPLTVDIILYLVKSSSSEVVGLSGRVPVSG